MTNQRPTEHKLWPRLRFRIFGTWPQKVVNERLAEFDRKDAEIKRLIDTGTPWPEIDAWIKENA